MSTPARPVALVLEKIMSASPDEFHRSIAVLDASRSPALSHRLACGAGFVTITYAALPSVRLGTLLELPRAKITLTFEKATEQERAQFMPRFDLAFRRGGG